MVKKMTISIDDWVYYEILENVNNRSALVQEALIKHSYQKINKESLSTADEMPCQYIGSFCVYNQNLSNYIY